MKGEGGAESEGGAAGVTRMGVTMVGGAEGAESGEAAAGFIVVDETGEKWLSETFTW